MAWRLVDLTVPWGPEVQPLDGHPAIQFSPITTHEADKRSNTQVIFSIHTGTHIDSPYHFFPEGKTIDQVGLETLVGPARVFDLTPWAAPGKAITVQELVSAGAKAHELGGLRVLLRTDWATQHWNQADLYRANPYLSHDAAQWLADAGIVALGLDFAVDQGPPYPNHYVFLGQEIVLIENLINLGQIGAQRFTLVALPLKVVGGDGGPARVVAMIETAD
ncbi:MAG: cyclase family protein [Firmicutes bacterium]|nr:cyclase family protein [Bacillota bacterium]